MQISAIAAINFFISLLPNNSKDCEILIGISYGYLFEIVFKVDAAVL